MKIELVKKKNAIGETWFHLWCGSACEHSTKDEREAMEEFNKAKSRAESGQITRETVAEFDTDAPQETKP